MKKLFVTSIYLLSVLFIFAQSNYEKAMGQALNLWKQGKNMESASLFERISSAEKNNWLPRYYQALVLTTSAFQEKNATAKENLISKASEILSDKTQDKNSEWIVVKAMNYTAELTLDPASKGAVLAPTISGLYEKAIQLDPQNPRALSGLAEFNINMKKYFHQDSKKEYEDLKKALSLFQNEKPALPFAPNWGKERTEQLLQDQQSSK